MIAAQIVAFAPELSVGCGVGVGVGTTGSALTLTGNVGYPNVYEAPCFLVRVDVHVTSISTPIRCSPATRGVTNQRH